MNSTVKKYGVPIVALFIMVSLSVTFLQLSCGDQACLTCPAPERTVTVIKAQNAVSLGTVTNPYAQFKVEGSFVADPYPTVDSFRVDGEVLEPSDMPWGDGSWYFPTLYPYYHHEDSLYHEEVIVDFCLNGRFYSCDLALPDTFSIVSPALDSDTLSISADSGLVLMWRNSRCADHYSLSVVISGPSEQWYFYHYEDCVGRSDTSFAVPAEELSSGSTLSFSITAIDGSCSDSAVAGNLGSLSGYKETSTRISVTRPYTLE
jgi:hypothetical protein